MDVAAAERSVRGFLAAAGNPLPSDRAFSAGRFMFLTGDLQAARRYFQGVKADSYAGLPVLFEVIVSDMLKETGPRDAALSRMAKLPNYDFHRPIAAMYTGWVAANEPPSDAAFEKELAKLVDIIRPDAEFAFGCFLYARGHDVRALAHWNRCEPTAKGLQLFKTHAHALAEVVEKKMPPQKGM